MTNKLKKETVENILNDVITYRENWLSCNEVLGPTEEDILKYTILKALSIQKQEDDERFEEFIKRLKEGLIDLFEEPKTSNKFVNKLVEELKSKINGENKK